MKERDKKLYACVDVHVCENQKIALAGRQAELVGWLHIAGITYAKRNNTDGFIPAAIAQMLTPSAKKLLRIITETCELWEKTSNGFRVHHYAEWQETSAEIAAKSEARAVAGAVGGAVSAISRAHKTGQKTTKQTRSKRVANASPFADNLVQQNAKQNEAYEDEDEKKDESKTPPVVPQEGDAPPERKWSPPTNWVGYYMDGFFKLYGRNPLIEGAEHGRLHIFAKKCKTPEVYAQVIDGFFASTDGWAAERHHSVACLVGDQPDRWLPIKPTGGARASPLPAVSPPLSTAKPYDRDNPEPGDTYPTGRRIA